MPRAVTLTRVLVIRPGATEFDDQGRMKGSLDMPLSDQGRSQVTQLCSALSELPIRVLYCCPCESARATAEALASLSENRDVRIKVVDGLKNVDHGLWHGKLIDEVRRNHSKVYRQACEYPDEFCPPGGEGIVEAKVRAAKALKKLLRKSRDELSAIIVPEPMASVVTSVLKGDEMESLWLHETDAGLWEMVETEV